MAIDLLQIAGAGAVMSGATAMGRAQAARYRRRPEELRELAAALRSVRNDISYARLPLGESIRRLTAGGQTRASPVRQLFADVATHLAKPGVTAQQAFAQAFSLHVHTLSITQEDRAVLEAFSRTAGLIGPEEQLGQLDAALAALADREREAVHDRSRYERVFQTTGALIGVLVVILLI